MARPRDGQDRGTIKVRIYNETYQTIRHVTSCRVAIGERPEPTGAEIIEGLLEIAFRCLEEHGSDFAKPYLPKEALRRAKALISARVVAKRRRGQRGCDKRPRKKRA